ncbi:alginate export family protein [Myxococcota bacterium]
MTSTVLALLTALAPAQAEEPTATETVEGVVVTPETTGEAALPTAPAGEVEEEVDVETLDTDEAASCCCQQCSCHKEKGCNGHSCPKKADNQPCDCKRGAQKHGHDCKCGHGGKHGHGAKHGGKCGHGGKAGHGCSKRKGKSGCARGEKQTWYELGLQVRPRWEKAFVGHLGVPRTPGALAQQPNYRVTQRTRLKLSGGVGSFRAHASIQDVRVWAGESHTLTDFSAEGLDAHEGWAQIGERTMLRVGRQEIFLDEHRLIGTVNWTQQARSFDGALFRHQDEDYVVTLAAARVPDGGTHDVLMAHGAIDVDGFRVAVPLVFQTNAMVAGNDRGSREDDWHRFTGGIHAKQCGDIFWRLEAYAQTGTNHFAYMAGGRIGYKISDVLRPLLWVDYLSGDSDLGDDRTGAFDTLFATNHKFYGYMDRFTSLPADTRQGGLIDIAIKNKGKLGPGVLEIALHEFLLANNDVSPSIDDDHSPLVGAEADVVYTVPLHELVKLHAGAGIYIDQGDFAAQRDEVLRDGPKVHDWFYLMLDLSI